MGYGYKDHVKKSCIEIRGDAECRYLLRVPLSNKNNERKVLVIMKNPSRANKDNSDRSVNNVIEFCKSDYKEVYIMNLFPCYSKDPRKVKCFIKCTSYNDRMHENQDTLIGVLNKIDDVIIAWGGGGEIGNALEYKKVTEKTCDILKNANKKMYAVRVSGDLKKKKYPWHPQVWAVKKGLEKFEWLSVGAGLLS